MKEGQLRYLHSKNYRTLSSLCFRNQFNVKLLFEIETVFLTGFQNWCPWLEPWREQGDRDKPPIFRFFMKLQGYIIAAVRVMTFDIPRKAEGLAKRKGEHYIYQTSKYPSLSLQRNYLPT